MDHNATAILVSSLLFLYCNCFPSYSFTSTSLLALMVLVLSILYPLLISKLRKQQLYINAASQDDLISIPKPAVIGENTKTEKKNYTESAEKTADTVREVAENTSVGHSVSVNKEEEEDQRHNTSVSSNACSFSDVDICLSTECSEDSPSDDENLIEIALPDGHFVATKEPFCLQSLPNIRGKYQLPQLLPESMFRQRGIMELLSEINEEDNYIEIDINRGSIKCSRFEIKA